MSLFPTNECKVPLMSHGLGRLLVGGRALQCELIMHHPGPGICYGDDQG